ncbi:MAG TPA: ABC transporter C-terminal domain-containing protein [Nannocystis sp.]|jgi:septal ring factor EnvC (AmiA/AmiB activator)
MPRRLCFVLCLTAIAGCHRKLGAAGATCKASADCAAELQCVAATCVDPPVLSAARAAEQAERARQEAIAAEQNKQMAKLLAELEALKAEQAALEQQKQALDSKLGLIVDQTEKQRLLAEKAALDAALAQRDARTPAKPVSKAPPAGP